MEDEEAKKPVRFQIGQDVSDMSVDELTEMVTVLKEEIERLEQAAGAKSTHLNAAEALFK